MSGPSRLAHAHHARLLVNACHGLEAAALACRLSSSHLQRACDPNDAGATMLPVDVVADLEAYCGQPVISGWLHGLVSQAGPAPGASLVGEACDVVARAAALMEQVRAAQADGRMSPNERMACLKALASVQVELGHVAALLTETPT